MATAALPERQIISGSFLLAEQQTDIFTTPDDLNDNQKLIKQIAQEFACAEVAPKIDVIEQGDFTAMRQLIHRACEINIGNADIPKEFGGSGRDQLSATLIAEFFAASGSVNASYAAHSTLGTLPIVLFGNIDQKAKYLPGLAKGELIAAFALAESSSGSDALNVETVAAPSEDGRDWVLDGEKGWVTNGSFADIFIVFAKADHHNFTAFIVEKTFPGLHIGPEYRTIGARGSGACSLVMNHCRVPKENLLGEFGKGHVVAFNTLNIGRLRLGASSLGNARNSLCGAVRHIKARRVFGRAVAEFGCTKEKIATMTAMLYAGEAMLYRTAGAIEKPISVIDRGSSNARELIAKALEESAAECSMVKVWSSECLGYVVDEALQMFGSAGLVQGHPAGRAFRDARLNRISEGTNEINRLIMAVWIIKRAINNKLRIGESMRRVRDEVLGERKAPEIPPGPLSNERLLVENIRKATLMVVGMAWQEHGMALVDQQEIITAFADLLMEYYAADSAVRRVRRMIDGQGEAAAQIAYVASQLTLVRALDRSAVAARKAIGALSDIELGDKCYTMLCDLLNQRPFNTIALSQQLASHVIQTDAEGIP